ncbi:helix-turn-helix transcriptional regulator [Streptomyces jumonjinensis]|uniref:helix-turn-helix transcriptional regulator n=1 Tax=Streptomyces jumonjinensis TaxID=1945 RepID=UPI00379F8496
MSKTPRLITTKELAEFIRKSPGAVRQMRYRGIGPKGARVGTEVLYDLADVESWWAAKTSSDALAQRAA